MPRARVREPLPGQLDSTLDQFQRLLVLRCLRPDRLTHGLQDFVSEQLGERFIETQVGGVLGAERGTCLSWGAAYNTHSEYFIHPQRIFHVSYDVT